ncbi:hypothetical protein V6N13_111962 [Hibiscus sabdariffa]|uniref:Uncharacterized protein n=1 Tax=Hibiscus sabdariffa TaxID=183260 RepID=A0ABR2TLU2_9ROSI
MNNSEAYPWSSDQDSDQDPIPGLKWRLYYHPFEPILFNFIAEDNKDAFVQRIKYGRNRSELCYNWYQSPELLFEIFDRFAMYNAVKCATALLAGKAGFRVDINALGPDGGSSPLFFTYHPELVNLYIRKGARTDIRCEGMLPFNKALNHLRKRVDWSSKQSICMVIVSLCLKYLDLLESIRLLFDNTKEVVKEVYDYVKGGKLVETTALLMVAREEITSPSYFEDFTSSGSMSLHQLVSLEIESLKASQTKLDSTDEEIHELENELETMNSMLHLIKVLESVGPEIDKYRQDLPKLSMEELATKVAYLLISRGFVEYEDLKRSVLSETSLKSYQHFLKLLESKLHGDIEGSHLESKDVAGSMGDDDQSQHQLHKPASLVKNCNGGNQMSYVVSSKHDGREKLADTLEKNDRPLEAVVTNYELRIKQLVMELEKERDKLGSVQMRLQEEHKLNEYFQEELKSVKLEKEKAFTELNKLRAELNGEIVDISDFQTKLNGLEDDSADDTVKNFKTMIVPMFKESTHQWIHICPDAYDHAKLSKREEEEFFVKLSQTERAVAEGKARVNKLDEDNGKLRLTLQHNMTRLNTMFMDSDYLVDRRIVIKLLVTYFRSNRSKEVLNVMVRMLGFSGEDKQSIGIAEQGTGKGVVPGVLGLPGRLFGGILGGGSADVRADIAPGNQSNSRSLG